jgi:uncharacterized protein
MTDLPVHQIVALWGFGLGIAFGALAHRTNFCTMGAISDIAFLGDFRRFRAWLLAIAVAVAGTQTLGAFGLVDLGKTIYATPNFGWLGAILGGLMFGFGMTLAGGCGSKTLVRLGAGNLKSLLVVLVLGIFAYMTLRGLIASGRIAAIEPTNVDLKTLGAQTQLLPTLIAAATGVETGIAQRVASALVVAFLAWVCFKDANFRKSPRNIAAGIGVGLLTVAGWYATGVAGDDDFEPTALASFTFVAPIGDTLVYLMTWTGAKIGFGVAGVLGVMLGAFVAATASREFRIESFVGTGDMLRHLAGAALMGTGGVLALGCTIGQGVTGLSTLALGSLLAFASIVCGGLFGMKYLEHGAFVPALKALAARA